MASDGSYLREAYGQTCREISGELLTFREWLKHKYGYTPQELYDLCTATGRYGDYNKVMEWYRRRYQQDNELREQLLAANPFTQPLKGGNENGYDAELHKQS